MKRLWQLPRLSCCAAHPRFICARKSHRRFLVLPLNQKLEEEVHDDVAKHRYYPIQLGEVIRDRYQVLGKLGFGLGSTVWLASELGCERYVALKVFTNDQQNKEEIENYNHLMRVDSKHDGRNCIRKALDSFTITSAFEDHQCLTHEPMLETLLELLKDNPRHRLNDDLLRLVIHEVLTALDFLHTEAHMIHTDISAHNILLGIDDKDLLPNFAKAEQHDPSPCKTLGGYTIYKSRAFEVTNPNSIGLPLLSDFGSAVSGEVENTSDVQPNIYRAPEICIKAPWSYPIDIWNVGCLIWDISEGRHLFYGKDPVENRYLTRAHLAEMVALMGPPPIDLLEKGSRSSEFFDEHGQFCAPIPVPEPTSLEETEEELRDADRKAFLRFMRKMIQWRPENRETAKELLCDDWLNYQFEGATPPDVANNDRTP